MALFGKKKKTDAAVPPVATSDDPFGTATAAPQEAGPSPAAHVEPPKPKVKVYPDVYTLFLGLSALALTIACVLLYLSVAKYGANPISGVPRAMITLFGV